MSSKRAGFHSCGMATLSFLFFFFFNDTATTEIYTLSLHDALPILREDVERVARDLGLLDLTRAHGACHHRGFEQRSEEHTSELQSRQYLVCRLLLEKKKKNYVTAYHGPVTCTSSKIRDSCMTDMRC